MAHRDKIFYVLTDNLDTRDLKICYCKKRKLRQEKAPSLFEVTQPGNNRPGNGTAKWIPTPSCWPGLGEEELLFPLFPLLLTS